MKNAESILVISSFFITFAVWICSTYKTGFVAYSPWSLLKRNQPKFTVDRTKRKKFWKALLIAFALNILYGLIITRDVALVVDFSLFNMIFLTYSLYYLILLKEDKTKAGR